MRYYVSEGRIEEMDINDGRVPGDYIIAHNTIGFEEYNTRQDCLVLYKGGEKLCVAYMNKDIGEPVVINHSQAVSFTKATVEVIWQMLTGFETAIRDIPFGFQINVSEVREELKGK